MLPLTIWAMPRQMVWVPRVATKGGSLHFATSTPLAVPVAMQAIMVSSSASRGCMPLHMSVALIMQLMPTTEPMDRSMLAVIST